MQDPIDAPIEDHEAFLARLGHDLRNPLNAMSAALAVLEIFPPGSAEADEARGVIGRQAERLRTIVEQRLTPHH